MSGRKVPGKGGNGVAGFYCVHRDNNSAERFGPVLVVAFKAAQQCIVRCSKTSHSLAGLQKHTLGEQCLTIRSLHLTMNISS